MGALRVLAWSEATALVQQFAPVGLDVAHAEQFKEGLGEREVHQTVVLDTLGQEDAQEVEELGDALKLLAVLRERCWEEAARALHIEPWRLQTTTQVHLNTDRTASAGFSDPEVYLMCTSLLRAEFGNVIEQMKMRLRRFRRLTCLDSSSGKSSSHSQIPSEVL